MHNKRRVCVNSTSDRQANYITSDADHNDTCTHRLNVVISHRSPGHPASHPGIAWSRKKHTDNN